MPERLIVHRDEKPIYDIVLEHSFAGLAGELSSIGVSGRRCCVVTDSNVAPLYLLKVTKQLETVASQVISHVIPAGEENKTLDRIQDIYKVLIEAQFDRKDLLVALGGGVVGDMCGYAAATYLRGISFIQIPTTLLSQVDSSIGGKTGVDFDKYKNMVGAFHMPKLVYINCETLLSLPEEQFDAGMGEVIKHGLIMDREYYQWIRDHREAVQSRDLTACEELIAGSCRIKRQVVEKDPTEQGVRAWLNFGHTLGHAIEKLSGFSLLHGQCVALGSLAAAYLSAQRSADHRMSMEDVDVLRQVLIDYRLPVTLPSKDFSPEAVVDATKHDKKMDNSQIRFVLLEQIGCAYIDKTVTEEEMRRALDTILC